MSIDGDRSLQETLPSFFLESWTYSSALSVVDLCDGWSAGFQLDAATQASFNAVKGELLELARNQVRQIQPFDLI